MAEAARGRRVSRPDSAPRAAASKIYTVDSKRKLIPLLQGVRPSARFTFLCCKHGDETNPRPIPFYWAKYFIEPVQLWTEPDFKLHLLTPFLLLRFFPRFLSSFFFLLSFLFIVSFPFAYLVFSSFFPFPLPYLIPPFIFSHVLSFFPHTPFFFFYFPFSYLFSNLLLPSRWYFLFCFLFSFPLYFLVSSFTRLFDPFFPFPFFSRFHLFLSPCFHFQPLRLSYFPITSAVHLFHQQQFAYIFNPKSYLIFEKIYPSGTKAILLKCTSKVIRGRLRTFPARLRTLPSKRDWNSKIRGDIASAPS